MLKQFLDIFLLHSFLAYKQILTSFCDSALLLHFRIIGVTVSCCKVVTSRLGRSGQAHSRAGSAASGSCSAGSGEPETIQWKRGNILGKGAYGTVSHILSSAKY